MSENETWLQLSHVILTLCFLVYIRLNNNLKIQRKIKELQVYRLSNDYHKDFIINNFKQNTATGKGKIDLLFDAIKQNGMNLEIAENLMISDKDVILEVVKKDSNSIEFINDHLKSDKNFVMELIKQNGMCLEFAADNLKSDKDVVLEAIKESFQSL